MRPFLKRALSFFYKDLPWKLLALGLSVLLWLVSPAMFDPAQNHSYTRPLMLDNLNILINEDVVLLNEEALPELVDVGLRAAASEHNALAPETIRAAIDFRAVLGREIHEAGGPVEIALPVGVNLPPGFNLLHTAPFEVVVWLDARVRATFPVEVMQTGDTGPGTELQSLRLANTFVALTGPRSYMERVARVQVSAEVQDLTENTARTVPLTVYDAFGNDMTDLFTLGVSETTLHIDILPVKRVAIIPEITGTLAPGFAVAEITTEPAEITIVGTAAGLAEIDFITPVFDLDGADGDFERVIDLTEWLPEGTAQVRGERAAAYVRVMVEPINERVFTVSRRDIGVFGYALHAVLGDPTFVSVRVSGPESLVAGLTAADVAVRLVLHNYPIGVHRIPLQVILPPGLQLVGAAPSFEVQIYEPAGPGEAETNGGAVEIPPPDGHGDPGDVPGDVPGNNTGDPDDPPGGNGHPDDDDPEGD
jgi:YbbR domain-containing protein